METTIVVVQNIKLSNNESKLIHYRTNESALLCTYLKTKTTLENQFSVDLYSGTEFKIRNKVAILAFFSSSLLYPNIVSLCCATWLLKPSLLHLRFSKTSSMGIFSSIHKFHKIRLNHKHQTKTIKVLQVLLTKSTASLLMTSRVVALSAISTNWIHYLPRPP